MSELRADTITASDGTSPVTLTKQSAAKAWANWNGNASPATLRDSFNISSLDDNGTGSYDLNFSTSMNSANYSWGNGGTNDGHSAGHHIYEISTLTSYIGVVGLAVSGGNTGYDSGNCFGTIHGDLA